MTGTLLDAAVVRHAAIEALHRNDLGTMTTAAPNLYPHQWSWDAAFVAIGLARVDVARAVTELRSLLAGAVEHRDDPAHPLLAPRRRLLPRPRPVGHRRVSRPARRASAPRASASRPCTPSPCGTCSTADASGAAPTGPWPRRSRRESLDELLAWHRWLATARDPDGVGLVEIHHSWESGFDNSPRWDTPYARITPGPVPPFARRDTHHVASAAERPSDAEYTRYLWLVEQLQVPSATTTRAFARHDRLPGAGRVLLRRARGGGRGAGRDRRRAGAPDDAADQLAVAARFRAGVASTVDPTTGLARDYDVRAGAWVGPMTVAGFAPLVAGGDAGAARRPNARCCAATTGWGIPRCATRCRRSTSPTSPDFRPRTYWRGPVWPFLNLLLGWACARDGATALSDELRTASLEQLSDLTFAEYYEPVTGAPLGSHDQAWTAAAALEWLG